jgi:hypothetical protein
VRSQLEISERLACAAIGQPRSTQRRHLKTPDDEAALTAAIVRLATRYGRYGYRREMLVTEGWRVAACFTVVSVARQYVLRRLFNGRQPWALIRAPIA